MRHRNFLLLPFLLFAPSIFAGHLIGGSLRYVSLGNNQWFFELEVWRDCNSLTAPLDDQVSIAIYRNGSLFNTVFPLVLLDTVETIPLNVPSCAGFPLAVCVERGIYRFTKVLPASPFPYVVAYQRCCLSAQYTNLANANQDHGLTLTVTLTPEAQQAANSNPEWPGPPPFLACAHTPLNLDFSTTDADGDSLSYVLCAPLNGGGPITNGPAANDCQGAVPTPACPPPYAPVPAAPGYSDLQPLGSATAQFFPDGSWTVEPALIGSFLYAVCVREYRNGVLLSEGQRVLSLYVLDGSSATAEPEASSRLVCSPNPVAARATLSWPDFAGESVCVTVYDALGRVVLAQNQPGGQEVELNVAGWPAGRYIVQAKSARGTATGHLVKW